MSDKSNGVQQGAEFSAPENVQIANPQNTSQSIPQVQMSKPHSGGKLIPILIIVVTIILVLFFAVAIGSSSSSKGSGLSSTTTYSSNSSSSKSKGTGWEANSMISQTTGATGSSASSSSGWDVEEIVESIVGDSTDTQSNSSDVESTPQAPQAKAEEKGEWISGTQKIVYTAAVSLETTEFDKAYAGLKALIEQNHGFISKEETAHKTKYHNTETSLTVRIPAENFQSFYDNIGTDAVVVSSSSNANNITKQYSETQSKISSLEVQEQRLLELEKGADSVENLLNIEDRLQKVREELTVARNSLSSMDTDVTYSTIDITLIDMSERGSTPAAQQELGERASSAAQKAWEDFVSDTEDMLVSFISDWPGHLIRIIVLGTVIVIIVIVVRRHNRKPALNAQPNPPQIVVEEQENNSDLDQSSKEVE